MSALGELTEDIIKVLHHLSSWYDLAQKGKVELAAKDAKIAAAEKLAEAIGEAIAKAHSCEGEYGDAEDFLADVEGAHLRYEKAVSK